MPMEVKPARRFFYAPQGQIHRIFGVLVAVAVLLSPHSAFAQRKPGAGMRYRVILPAGYENTSERYPSLFLLHGFYGDFENWSTRTNLISYAGGIFSATVLITASLQIMAA